MNRKSSPLDARTLKASIVERIRARLPFPHYRLFLFGSRAAGGADARSDFDIGIEAPMEIPLHIIHEIREDLDRIPVLQKIEVVDFAAATEDFKAVALQKIEVLYEQ